MNILYVIAIILLAIWLAGVIFKVAGGIIHLLLIVAVILVLFRLLRGRRPI